MVTWRDSVASLSGIKGSKAEVILLSRERTNSATEG